MIPNPSTLSKMEAKRTAGKLFFFEMMSENTILKIKNQCLLQV
jgi:hypothetical protein